MVDSKHAETEPREQTDGSAGVPWTLVVVLTLVTLVALGAVGWLFFDRGGIRDELARTRVQVATLRDQVLMAQATREELEAQIEELGELGEAAVEARQACRHAVRNAVRMWNDLVRALNAASEPDAATFERFSERAENRRGEVNRAQRECERASTS